MKKQLIYIFSTLACMFLLCSTALAQDCPSGTQKVIIPDTNEALCINLDEQNASVAPTDQNSDDEAALTDQNSDNENVIDKHAISSSGPEFNIGMGYGMIAAFDLRLMGGYQFALQNLDGVAFGLYTDFSIRFPLPNSLDWALVPSLIVYGESFRVTFGLGIGVAAFFANHSKNEYDYDFTDDDGYMNKKALFQLKPEMRFDWFLSEHVLLGFNTDVSVFFYEEEKELYYDTPTTKKSVEKKAFPWLSLTVHVGYKF